jgi:hypothetical protein
VSLLLTYTKYIRLKLKKSRTLGMEKKEENMNANIIMPENGNCFERKNIVGVARCLLRNGFSVVPLRHAGGKLIPGLPRWEHLKREPLKVEEVEINFRNSEGVAIVTGQVSDCIALDVDDVEKFSAFYPIEKLKEEASIIVKSPKNNRFHVYFKYTDRFDSYTNYTKEAGFELKTGGSLLTIFSLLAELPYRIEKSSPLEPIPQELADRIEGLKKKRKATSNNSRIEYILDKVYKITGYEPKQRKDNIWRAKCPVHDDVEPSLDIIMLEGGKVGFKCWAGCEEKEIKEVLGLSEIETKKKERAPEKEKLAELFNGFEFFHDAFQNCYCKTKDGLIWKISDSRIKGYIYSEFMKMYGKIPYSQAVADLIQYLKGLSYEGRQERVFTRVATDEDLIEILLRPGLSLQITPNEIKVDRPINTFIVSSGFQPLPEPIVNFEVDYKKLTEFINVSAEQALIITLWLLGSFNPVEKPLLLILGEKEGVGKSLATTLIKRVIDPSVLDLTSFPYSEEDLIVSASNSFILAFDNVGRLPKEAQNWLCRLATGGGLKRRKRFTDDDTAVINVMSPIILNAINNPLSQVDIRRRTLTITLKILKSFKTKELCLKDFNKMHPYLLFYIANLLQNILKNKGIYGADLDLADFSCFVSRSGLVNSVSALIKQNRKQLVEETVEDNPIVDAIKKILTGKESAVVYAKDIINEIEKEKPGLRLTPKKIHNELKLLITDLETLGVKIRRQRTEGGYEIHLEKIKNNVQDVQDVQNALNINKLENAGKLNFDIASSGSSGTCSCMEVKKNQWFAEDAEHAEHEKDIFLNKKESEDEEEEFTW